MRTRPGDVSGDGRRPVFADVTTIAAFDPRLTDADAVMTLAFHPVPKEDAQQGGHMARDHFDHSFGATAHRVLIPGVTGRAKCTSGGRLKVYHPSAWGESYPSGDVDSKSRFIHL